MAEGEDAKPAQSEKHFEHVDVQGSLVYDDAEHEPELHIRTWIALAAMCLFNYVVVFALLSPPAVVSTFISPRCNTELDRSRTLEQAWAPRVFKPGC